MTFEITYLPGLDLLIGHACGRPPGRFREELPGFFLEVDADGNVIGFECLDLKEQNVNELPSKLPKVHCIMANPHWTGEFSSPEECLETIQIMAKTDSDQLRPKGVDNGP